MKINPELSGYFKGKVHKWTEELLEQSIRELGGAITPVIVWKEEGVLVDGHRRLEICERLGLPYKIEEMSFANIEEVKEFMKSWQFCRRNVTDHMFSLAVAKSYKGAHKSWKEKGGKFVSEGAPVKETMKKFGVSKATLFRDVEFGEALDKLGPEISEKIVKGDIKCSKPTVVALSKEAPSDVERIVKGVEEGKIDSVGKEIGRKVPTFDRMLLCKQLKEALGRFASKLNEIRVSERAKYYEIREHVHNIGLALNAWEETLL